MRVTEPACLHLLLTCFGALGSSTSLFGTFSFATRLCRIFSI